MSIELCVGTTRLEFIGGNEFTLFADGLLNVFYSFSCGVPLKDNERLLLKNFLLEAGERKEHTYYEYNGFGAVIAFLIDRKQYTPKQAKKLQAISKIVLRKAIQYALKVTDKDVKNLMIVFLVQWCAFCSAIDFAVDSNQSLLLRKQDLKVENV